MNATLLGLRLRIHPTWLLAVALIVVSVPATEVDGGALLPEQVRWAVGMIVALLYFLSVLVHELAHALVARRFGLPVGKITLFIFGGAPSLEKSAPDPRSEALIAVAGPLVSLALATVCLVAWAATLGLADGIGMLVGTVAWWVGVSNLVLGGLNLVPGFPMDGLRIVRAGLWSVTRDFLTATRKATYVGRAVAYGLIALGLAFALAEELLIGIWLALMGWLLSHAAEGAYRRVEFGTLIADMHVRDVMEHDVAVVGPNLTLDTLVEQHLLRGQSSLYPVTMDGLLVGTVEIAQVRSVPRGDWPTTRVTEVMNRGEKLTTLTEPLSLLDAVTRLDESGAPAIPVVAEGDRRRLLGLLTRDGLARALRHRAALRRGDGR